MTNLEAWSPAVPHAPDIEGLFRARYLEMVRLAGLLGADDPEDIAQEAFTRLMNKRPRLDDPLGALPPSRGFRPAGARPSCCGRSATRTRT